MVIDASPTSRESKPKRYLSAMMAVARSARRGEYAIVYFSSGTFFRTDRLGALAMRALISGRSDADAIELVERVEAGAGGRARQMIDVLDSVSALTRNEPPVKSLRWRLRRQAARATGTALSAVGPLVRVAPTRFWAWIFSILPSNPVARHVWGGTQLTILNNLRASGYADRPESWLVESSRRCVAAPSHNFVFMYLSTVLVPDRLGSLFNRVFDLESVEDLAARLGAAGPVVAAFLHGPLSVAVPTVLRNRGREMVRVVIPWTHGRNLSEASGPIRDFFGEPPHNTVALTDALGLGELLRHLKSGRSVFTALDEPARVRKPVADIHMLGRWFPRNDGPAWLSVKSGRPLMLWTTHRSTRGIVITASEMLIPDPSLPVDSRVAALSERLYARAEAAIHEHPEAWGRGWALWGYRRAGLPVQLRSGSASQHVNA